MEKITKSTIEIELTLPKVHKEVIIQQHLMGSTPQQLIQVAKATFNNDIKEFDDVKNIVEKCALDLPFEIALMLFQTVLLDWMTYSLATSVADNSPNVKFVEWNLTDLTGKGIEQVLFYLKDNFNSVQMIVLIRAAVNSYSWIDKSVNPTEEDTNMVKNLVEFFYPNVPFSVGLMVFKVSLLKTLIFIFEAYIDRWVDYWNEVAEECNRLKNKRLKNESTN